MARRSLLGGIAGLLLLGSDLRAEPAAMVGFPGDAASTQLDLEARFAGSLEASNLRASLAELSAVPHHAGSPGGRKVAEALVDKFRSWGFEAEIEPFYALVPTPRKRSAEMLAPRRFEAALNEPPLAGHAPEDEERSLPPYNAYSRDGRVTARAVYVNYGLPEDYDVLSRNAVDVKGKIVIARYGKAFRGIKPRLAGEKGAVGAILYSDPADYGYARGIPYPDGPFLPSGGSQRGSVLDVPRIAGDPLTPGTGATEIPKSWSLDDVATVISPIPVLPLSADDVRPILEAMTGAVVPPEWRGALPIPYRFGGNVDVRLEVEQDWNVVPVYDVVAKLEGSTWPNEWVLRGNNHDAWNYGALVPLSGLVTLLEEARGLATRAANRPRPKRTLVYLAWDGEEQGLVGSTEWVETHADELREKAVAYLNTGVTTRGFFEAGGSHALETLVDDVTRVVRDPKLQVPVSDRVAASIRLRGEEERRQDLEASDRYRLAPLGLGSDWTPFLHHLGIPSLDYAFDGEADSGVYHSIYDNFDFYDRFGDPGYEYGVKLAEAGGRTMLRLANAEILPFDFSGMSDAIARYVKDLEQLANGMRAETRRENARIAAGLHVLASDPTKAFVRPRRKRDVPQLPFARLGDASQRLGASATRFSKARELFEVGGTSLEPSELVRLNQLIRHAEQVLAPTRGLPRRPWYRHRVYAPGYDTGYGAKTLPGVREAVERREWEEAEEEIHTAAGLIEAYAAKIDEATAILEQAGDRSQ